VKLVLHPGSEPWEPSPSDRAALDRKFPGDRFVGHLYPRRDADRVLGRPSGRYAFRAFTRDGVSHVLVDKTETRRSIAWLLAHELSHQALHHANRKELFANQRGVGDPASDQFHQTDAEELACDDVATALFGERLDRAWWRKKKG
jgi:hypothetical protein